MPLGNRPIARYVTGAVVVVAMATGAVCEWARTMAKLDASERAARSEASRIAALEEHLSQMQDTVALQGARAAQAFANPTQNRESPAPATAAPEAPPAPTAPAVSMGDMQDAVESKFVSDKQDVSWSRPAADRARTTILALLPEGSRLDSIDCRASMCRVEVTHPDERSFHQFTLAPSRALDRAWPGSSMVALLRTEPNGEVVSVSYLGREESGPLIPE
jgi:hypothetical protein